MSATTLVLALCAFSSVFLVQATKDYYWRDYDGTIPEDAILAGLTKARKNIYIGQVYVQNEGLPVVQINRDKKDVYAEMEGIKHLDQNIKILCGPSENFYWLPTNLSRLKVDLKRNQLVVGGHEDGWGRYFVGRIECDDGLCIGKVLEKGWLDRSIFLGVNKHGHKLEAESYEVLVNEGVIKERNAIVSE